jgi:hypothetical protein
MIFFKYKGHHDREEKKREKSISLSLCELCALRVRNLFPLDAEIPLFLEE